MKALKSVLLGACLVLGTASAVHAAPNSAASPGTLDPTFGHKGVIPVALPSITYPIGMSTAADGSILVLGNPEYGSVWRVEDDCGEEGSYRGVTWSLKRYRPDGQVMSSFGRNGQVVQHFSGDSTNIHYSYPSTVFAQGDGKIVVAGIVDVAKDMLPAGSRKLGARISDQDCEPGFAFNKRQVAGAVRFLPDGRHDRSFGKNGTGVLPDHELDEVIATPDREHGIVLAGNFIGRSSGVMARLTPSGKPDQTFGEKGRVRLKRAPDSLAVDKLGRILAAGGDQLRRYDKRGNPDASFGVNGVVSLGETTVKSAVPTAHGITLLTYGEFATTGRSTVGIMKLDEAGGALPAFGLGGTIELGEGIPESMFIDSAGRTVVAWIDRAGKSSRRWRITRLSGGGVTDGAFDSSGGHLTFGGGWAPRLIAQPSRYGIVVAGRSGTKPGKSGRSPVLARFRD